MFIFDIKERKFPATQQYDAENWVLEIGYGHIDQNGNITYIPPSGKGSVVEMLKSPVWLTDYRSGWSIIDASVPKEGLFSAAYIKHDLGYASESKPRAELDWELLCDLQELGASWWMRNKVYSAVRLAGGTVWAAHDPKQVAALREYVASFTDAAAKLAQAAK